LHLLAGQDKPQLTEPPNHRSDRQCKIKHSTLQTPSAARGQATSAAKTLGEKLPPQNSGIFKVWPWITDGLGDGNVTRGRVVYLPKIFSVSTLKKKTKYLKLA
jgi:hypothetical protein